MEGAQSGTFGVKGGAVDSSAQTAPQQIVIGVDGSESSLDALTAAADLAKRTDSQLSVVFVRDPGLAGELAVEQTDDEIEAAASRRTLALLRDENVHWTFAVASGDVSRELVNVAERRHARLIVVGGSRRGETGDVTFPSVAQKLVRASPTSVLVIRRPSALAEAA